MAAARRISTDSARARGRSKVRAARWAAVRKRGYPPGARREQNPERHDRQGAHARRLRRRLCAGLGLLADWEAPYRTMDFQNEAGTLRAFARIFEKGYVFRGLKPVNWCFDCGSALAEAEIEYQDRVDTAIDVGFAFTEPERIAQAFNLPAAPGTRGWIVIWTTTPWTIPANQALNVHPDLSYSLVETPRGLLILASERV